MKIRPLLLTLLFALAMPLAMLGQDELTVYDGTTTNSYVPIEPGWTDMAQHSECIIPSTALSEMAGSDVISMKYYATSNFSFTGTFQVYLKEIEDAAFSSTSYYGSADANTVYTGTLTVESREMTISFDEAYHYQGGNLLVGFSKESGGNYSFFSFYGQNVANASIAAHGSSSPTVRNFIPKTTFTYIESEPYPKPRNLRASNVTATAATLSWNAGGTEDHWDLYYTTSSVAPEEETTPTESNISTNSIRLTDLSNGDTYYAYVRANYNNGEHYSAWTPACVFVAICSNPTNLHTGTITSNSAQLDWTNGGDDTAWQLAISNQSSFDPNAVTPVDITEKPYTVTGLVSGSTYYVCVRSNCGDGVSEWSNTCSFTVGCFAPTIVESQTQVACDMAYITWTAGGTETSWQVVYSDQQGFNPDAATSETVTTQYKVFENLITGITYYARVRAICATGDYSEWTAEVSFTPQCLAPSQLKVMYVSVNSAKLKWNVGSTETQWQISYSTTENFNPEDGTIVTVSTNPYVLEGLTVNTTYYAYVRAVCGNNIKSDWSIVCTFMPRYEQTVSDGTSYNSYIPVCCIATNYTTKSQFIIPAADLMDLQYGNITKLTFYAISETANLGAATFDVLVNELDGVTDFSANEFFDWSAMTTVYSGSLSISGSKMEITLSTPYQYLGGDLLIGFKQTNSGNSANIGWYGAETTGYSAYGGYELSYSNSYSRYKYIPKTTISYVPGTAPTCLKPKNLAASNVGATSATLSWTNGGNETAWVVEYATDANFTQNTASVNVPTNPYTLTGLTPETTYYAHVKTDCGNGDYSVWSNVCSFTPSAIQTVVVNNGTETGYYAPFYGSNAGSANVKSQFVVSSSELADVVGQHITQLTFHTDTYYSSASFPGGVFKVYLAPTTMTEFTSTTPVDWTTLTEVYSGSLSISNNKMEVILSAPYLYTGGNLLVAFDETTMSSSGTFISWLGITTANYPALSYITTYYYRRQFLPKMTVTYSSAITVCSAPTNLIVDAASDTATLTWTAGGDETNWNVQYKAASASDWSEVIAVDDTLTCTINGLSAATEYQVRIQANCGGSVSSWATESFATSCGSVGIPYSYDFSDVTVGSTTAFPLCWTRINNSENESYNYYPFVVGNGKLLRFTASANAPTNQIAVMPEMTADINTLRMSFSAYLSSGNSNKTLSVGVMTDPNDASTFTKVVDVVVRNTNTSTFYPISLEGYQGDGHYIAFKCDKLTSGSEYSIFIDNITVEAVPTVAPVSLPYSYNFDEAATGYNAFPPDGWHFSNTYYPYVYESASIAHSGSNFLLMQKPSTESACYAVLPPIDTTENAINTLKLSFWSRMWNSTSFYMYLSIGVMTDPTDLNTYQFITSVSVSNTYSLYEIYFDDYVGEGQYIVLRSFNTDNYFCVDDIEVSVAPTCRQPLELSSDYTESYEAYIRWKTRDLRQCNYQVSYSTTEGFDPDEGTIVDVEFENTLVNAGTSYRYYELTCLEANTTYYFYVRANCGADGYSEWSEDAGSFTTEEACPVPYYFDVDYSDTTATFVWYSNYDEEWGFRYKKTTDVEWSIPSDFGQGQGGTASGANLEQGSEMDVYYTLNGLEPGTEYEAQLRKYCGVPDCPGMGASYSDWVTVTFTTLGSRNILYVTPTGAGTMDGSSWENASNDLNAVLALASTMEQKPLVWVAEGTYTGDGVAANSAFTMVEDVDVYGGFVGNETEHSERDYVNHPTILDGQQLQRVLNQPSAFTETTSATWDGFIIQNGHTESGDAGAGAYLQAYSCLRNCVIRNNHASGNGGGVYMTDATLLNCQVLGNSATSSDSQGGGVYADGSDVVNCEVTGNSAYQGGGIFSNASDVLNTTIVNNDASYQGGGLYASINSTDYEKTNLILWGNTAPNDAQYYNASLTYSAIQGNNVNGTGNIALNEDNDGEGAGNYVRFIAPEYGIFQLQDNSDVVGIGSMDVTGLPDKDLRGHDRIMGGAIEPGAYEQYCTEYEYRPINFALGGTYGFYGTILTEPGTYIHQFASSYSCDSLVVAELTVKSIWYVTTTGTGTMDGSSWENASNDLNATLNYVAQQPGAGRRQVWVAQGTYTSDSYESSFEYVGGVEVHGGFAGNETELGQRDVAAHPTILQGVYGRVLLDASSQNPCSEELPGLWEGFVLQGGHYISVSDHFTLQNCKTGILTMASGILKNCEFTGFGEGSYEYYMVRLESGAVMDSCRVHHNLFTRALVHAEGATISHTLFYNNTFSGSSYYDNGLYGTILNAFDNTTIDHCDFLNNLVEYPYSPRAMWEYYQLESSTCYQPKYTIIALSGSTMSNCIVWGNDQDLFARNFIAKDVASEIRYCAIEGGLYNGVGNISLASANENGLFSVAFESPVFGTGYLNASDEMDWSLKSNSICLKHGEDGSDIGAIASSAPATLSVVPSADNIIYVDANGTGNGSSWADATPYLQYAVAHANTFEPAAQVWVKEGSYSSLVVDSLVAAFNVVNGVNVYGGFAGTESSLAERDIEAHPTYLDGQNAQRVLYQNEPLAEGKAAIWDGFVIRNGFMARSHYYDYNSSSSVSP